MQWETFGPAFHLIVILTHTAFLNIVADHLCSFINLLKVMVP